MSESGTTEIVQTYLAELRAALIGVPKGVSEGIISGVREELAGLSDTDASKRIRDLGDPHFIAAEARDQEVPSPAGTLAISSRAPWFDIIAALLVMVGGVVVPVVGAVAGVVMVWFSKSWTRAEKWITTLVPLILIALIAVVITVLSSVNAQSAAGPSQELRNPSLPVGFDLVTIGILLVLLTQLGLGIWLLVRLRRTRTRSTHEFAQ